MFIDSIATNNYAFYNTKIATAVGVRAASYLQVIIDICAYTKSKYATIDRKGIFSRTGLSDIEQEEIEKNLVRMKFIQKSTIKSKDFLGEQLKITIDENMIEMLCNATSSDVESLRILYNKTNSQEKKQATTDAIINNLINHITTTNTELKNAYASWIRCVFENNKGMTVKALVASQEALDSFCQVNLNGEITHDLDKALEVLAYAEVHGYVYLNKAISYYQKQKEKEL